ncbi:MAG: transcription elongation factor GreA [Chthonomonadales bacterium]
MSTDYELVLTPKGYAKIEKELERLRTVDRHNVADRIRDAKAFGEFAENAEYEDAKNEQAIVEGRIQELKRILQISQILRDEDIPTKTAGIGSIVEILDKDTKEQWEFTMVGFVESDPDHDMISDESPIGKSLFGRKVGDSVDVLVPDGKVRLKIVNIRK